MHVRYQNLFFLIAFVSAFVTARPATAQTLLDAEELKQAKTFFNLEEARSQPDSVLKLSLRGKKLKEIPPEVFTFPNLQVLNLSKNNIKEIPSDISKLKALQELDLSNNKLTNLPAQIGELSNLSKLKLNRNEITSLPAEISALINLEVLEMWDNELDTVPDEIKNLAHLKVFELRGILFSDEEQTRIHSLLPETKIYFSPSCNCKH
jgi:Leucine-rich repeat (LRR) protein